MTERFNTGIFSTGTVTYTDFDLNFKTNPITGDIRIKTDLDSIKQSLKNLLFTNKAERPFQPSLYGGLNELLFEPLDNITTEVLKNQIATVISNNEPRISIIDIEVAPKFDDNTLDVTLKFNMRNAAAPQVINIILQRRR